MFRSVLLGRLGRGVPGLPAIGGRARRGAGAYAGQRRDGRASGAQNR